MPAIAEDIRHLRRRFIDSELTADEYKARACNLLVPAAEELDRLQARVRELEDVLTFIKPSFPVLRDICLGAALPGGARQAQTMYDAVRTALKEENTDA